MTTQPIPDSPSAQRDRANARANEAWQLVADLREALQVAKTAMDIHADLSRNCPIDFGKGFGGSYDVVCEALARAGSP